MSELWAPGIEDEDRAWRRGDYDRDEVEPREHEDDSERPEWSPW